MLNKLDASNQELSKRVDRFERNGSISSMPLTSPTIPPANHSHRIPGQQPVIPVQHTQHSITGRLTTTLTEGRGITTDNNRPVLATNEARDAIAPRPDALRSIPSISTAVSQLLAS